MKGDVYDLFVLCEGVTVTPCVYTSAELAQKGLTNSAVVVVLSKEMEVYLKSEENCSRINMLSVKAHCDEREMSLEYILGSRPRLQRQTGFKS